MLEVVTLPTTLALDVTRLSSLKRMQRSTNTPSRDVFTASRPRYVDPIKIELPSTLEFPQRLSFYDDAPPADAEVSLEDFESWAVERMTVLDELDTIYTHSTAEILKEIRPVLNKLLPLSKASANTASVQRERFKDQMSHFILRLAFCQRSEDRLRFVRLETALFRIRYELTSIEERSVFVSSLKLAWPRASATELQEFEPLLRVSSPESAVGVHYKVNMEEVMDLVRRRRVVLRKGVAFVPESLQLSLLAKEFGRRLESSLEMLARYRARFRDDSRIDPVLSLANSGFAKSQYKADSSKIDGKFTAQSMDQLDKDNFLPMCASMLHQNLKKTRHAFHTERLHYQRFLKFMGMPVEQAIQLFTTYYNDDKKRNEIVYGVKHMYGLVGGRKENSAYSCRRVYEDGLNAKSNEVHGCPFQRLSPENLERLLRQHGITDAEGISEVKRHSSEKQIHLACSKTYELAHPKDTMKYDNAISSPNMYFERAWDYKKRQEKV